MNDRGCCIGTNVEGLSGRGRLRPGGLLLVFALLFSGDLLRIHAHPDGVPPATDCAACVAGLSSAVAGGVPAAPDAAPASAAEPLSHDPASAPSLDFVRQGGLRDPPSLLA